MMHRLKTKNAPSGAALGSRGRVIFGAGFSFVGAIALILVLLQPEALRSPQSINSFASFSKESSKFPRPPHFAKVGRPYDVQIAGESEWHRRGGVQVLEVRVAGAAAAMDFSVPRDQVFYEWNLPSHVNVTRGTTSGSWAEGQEWQTDLVLEVTDAEKLKQPVVVSLTVYVQDGDVKHGASATYSTNPHEVLVAVDNPETGEAELLSLTKGEVPMPPFVQK